MGRGGGMAVPFYDMAVSGVSQLETASWSQPAGVGTPFLRCRVFVLTWILESRAFPYSSTFNIPLVFPTKIYIAYSPPHTLQEVRAQEHSKAKKTDWKPEARLRGDPRRGQIKNKKAVALGPGSTPGRAFRSGQTPAGIAQAKQLKQVNILLFFSNKQVE